ncbi:hypothetical protein DFW101_1052 [Solidesulfovibrio carbinoliphilus subsp. oakridgensis]|uniref:General secretion pathway protein I n=1 Tax=Solidesulfovibrio carbinoliphilus subsp. oakridgensis TaxID=694327 RepID=G7Q647_9BACT|nr:type II secretion system protein [Solidesulfovibrio carbinoliphilus]EHJ47063.1 hypothetical protein DFW101_1052 [Solidesulfovibrio carbinoliphilus subsp. oakridgensis]
MHKQNRSAQGGFTLLEVMVATAIMAIGLTAVLTVFSASQRAVSQAIGSERARLEAERLMAELLQASPKAPFENTGDCRPPLSGHWRTRAGAMPEHPELTVFTVGVTFPTPAGTRTVTLETAQANMQLPPPSGAVK